MDNAEKLRRIRATRTIPVEAPAEGMTKTLFDEYITNAKGNKNHIAEWAMNGIVKAKNTNAYIGDVKTSKSSIKSILAHGHGPLKFLIIQHLDEVLENSVPYPTGKGKKPHLRFINLAHNITFEGKAFIAYVSIQEDANGNRTYDVEFGDEKRLSRELPAGAGAGETAHANPGSLDTATIPQSGAEVNTREETRVAAERKLQEAEDTMDAARRESAVARDEQAARQLFALRGYLAEADSRDPDPKATIPTLADSFATLCRQPLPEEPAARNRALADRRAALKKWRDAKNRELDLLKLRTALGVDPGARREYCLARENEAFRLEAREARAALDAEKTRIRSTPVAEGDALLSNTRAIGHVTVESRESYLKRKMAENGWSRKTAIAQATHLYPEDMQDLRAPWANRRLYTSQGGHSPDTAAQTLYNDGLIQEPTVDAFWDAVRGDIETVSRAKQVEIDAAEYAAMQALEYGLAQHRAALADIERRDAEGFLGLPREDDPRREVAAQGNATTVPSSAISINRALELLADQENEVFINIEQGASASINKPQRNKLVSDAARAKSHLNGFMDDEHLNAAVKAGELFRYGHLVEDRPGIIAKGREKGKEDPNVRIQRYATSVVIQRRDGPFVAVAYLTVKVSTSYRRPKPNQSEQTPNRIYSLELLELKDPRLQGERQTNNDVHSNAHDSIDTIPHPAQKSIRRRPAVGLRRRPPQARGLRPLLQPRARGRRALRPRHRRVRRRRGGRPLRQEAHPGAGVAELRRLRPLPRRVERPLGTPHPRLEEKNQDWQRRFARFKEM